ncbi:MAG: hypothetical protein H9Q66_04530 [Spiroplasma ixodetis]|nr:hypothetical protein [Spiroplasma ixodetis]
MMAGTKLQFYIHADIDPKDPKTTVVCVKRFRFADQPIWYQLPSDYWKVSHHPTLQSLPPFATAVKMLKNRGQFRNVNVILSAEAAAAYLDEAENPVFKGDMLAELEIGSTSTPTDPKIAELAVVMQSLKHAEPIKDILKHFLVSKFLPKNRNVKSWCEAFEAECLRFSLTGTKQLEVFKSCIDDSLEDWFAVTQQQLTLSASWEQWKAELISAFSDGSFRPVRSAFFMRYFSGSIVEFAVKKQRALLDLDSSIDLKMQIYLIVCGLPLHIQDSLNRESITSIQILHKKLKKFDFKEGDLPSYSNNNFNYRKTAAFQKNKFSNSSKNNNFDKFRNKKPCSICAAKGINRFHLDADCWSNPKNIKKSSNFTESEAHNSSDENQNSKNE